MSFLSVYYVCFCLASLVFCFVLVFLFDRVFITVFGQNQNWSKHGCQLTFVMGFRLGWQHCPIKFLGYFLTDLKFVLVTASNFCLFLFDFCYFLNKIKLNFIDFCKLVKFKNSRFCLNVTSEIGTVTFAFRRKLKTKIVDFDLKVFFWIASLTFNVKSAFLARLTNFIDIINFQSIFFVCIKIRFRLPLISVQNWKLKNVFVCISW